MLFPESMSQPAIYCAGLCNVLQDFIISFLQEVNGSMCESVTIYHKSKIKVDIFNFPLIFDVKLTFIMPTLD